MINQTHEKVLKNYFDSLVNSFFKILPIKESEEDTLTEYMQSLQLELIGCNSLFAGTSYDSALLSLIAILQYLIDNDCEMKVIRREVFKSIGICKMLKKKYFKEG
mgnify:CR=1 FL=1